MIKELINKIIECLESENKDRKYYNNPLIDIPFNIVTLEQYLNDDTYKELHNDLTKYDFEINFFEDKDEDGYLKERYIKVYLYEKGNEEDYYCDNFTNFTYKITLDRDDRDWGYCECSEEDEDYDTRYRCCGHGCDWTAPAFSITKEIHIGRNVFKGDQHDFWDYRDKYNNITEVDKKELEKLAKIKQLEEQKEYIENELKKLNSL